MKISFIFGCLWLWFQTSAAIASILYQLSLNPDKQEKLYQEINTVLPSPDSQLTAESIETLGYLKACVKETLRFGANMQ